jgi:hypothetical protein
MQTTRGLIRQILEHAPGSGPTNQAIPAWRAVDGAVICARCAGRVSVRHPGAMRGWEPLDEDPGDCVGCTDDPSREDE